MVSQIAIDLFHGEPTEPTRFPISSISQTELLMSPFRIPHRCESGAGPSDYLLMQNHGKIPSNIMHARINMHVQHLDNQTHNKITGLNSSLQVMQGCFVLQVAPLLLHTQLSIII